MGKMKPLANSWSAWTRYREMGVSNSKSWASSLNLFELASVWSFSRWSIEEFMFTNQLFEKLSMARGHEASMKFRRGRYHDRNGRRIYPVVDLVHVSSISIFKYRKSWWWSIQSRSCFVVICIYYNPIIFKNYLSSFAITTAKKARRSSSTIGSSSSLSKFVQLRNKLSSMSSFELMYYFKQNSNLTRRVKPIKFIILNWNFQALVVFELKKKIKFEIELT